MTTSITIILTIVQIIFTGWMARELILQYRWKKRCNYWKTMTIREYELTLRALARGDVTAAEQHAQANMEYSAKWLEAIKK